MAKPSEVPEAPQADFPAVLFFDGVCNLCNRTVDFLIHRDRKGALAYGPLQGATARHMIPIEHREGLHPTVVLVDENGTHYRSTAILRSLKKVGGGWKLVAGILGLIPRPVRDWAYDQIAKRRFKIWGTRDTCRIPSDAEKARFVD